MDFLDSLADLQNELQKLATTTITAAPPAKGVWRCRMLLYLSVIQKAYYYYRWKQAMIEGLVKISIFQKKMQFLCKNLHLIVG